ncbi:Crp/Fnr family transcriptional regulator [Flavihumibacter rivuli]|uniref:Crp/Fnr family transcriptional regulator n=1 Tax=Flavihumibacter rivuli TaxID=2838156 RepID=UPI001BDF353B|nr:Crp/Fnr family transcriptional regulator [Flavihumibacter rivuli]ULQ56591.1 Crp/Fnr family transcriptional regulator [Flavihumibacter rivuli]
MLRTNTILLQQVEVLAKTRGVDHIREKTYQPGEQVFSQDQALHHVLIIRSGIAKCFIREDNGRDYILEFQGPGEVVGELEQIDRKKAGTNLVALTKLEVFRIDGKYFNHLLTTDQAFNQLILQELAMKIRHTSIRSAYQQSYPVASSLLQLVTLIDEQELPLTKQDLADYLGITKRSLNRTIQAITSGKEKDNPELFEEGRKTVLKLFGGEQ